MTKQRETGKAQGHQVEGTEILNGLKLGNPSSTGETETNHKGRSTEHRHVGSVRLREWPGARIHRAPKAISRHLDFILKGLVGMFLRQPSHIIKA